ncbi:MAG: hypothetical protein E4G99_00540 [Anaerolineales bacterium]|nr:MAG: hypothetical protein E4G99_00540 [Anaerolineales bacterium]
MGGMICANDLLAWVVPKSEDAYAVMGFKRSNMVMEADAALLGRHGEWVIHDFTDPGIATVFKNPAAIRSAG